MNKAIILGNLTRDPEMKTLPSGMKVTNFSIATNRVWKNEAGEKQEAVDYHNIVIFGRQAETSAQYLSKGSKCIVEGRLQTQSWDDQATGKKMYRTEIVASSVQFLSSPNRDGQSREQGRQEYNQVAQRQKTGGVEDEFDTIEYPEEDINPDDIPF